jgi:uncharacterized ion transporter superfamily protein YfcC
MTVILAIIYKTSISECIEGIAISMRRMANLIILFSITGGMQEIIINSNMSLLVTNVVTDLCKIDKHFAVMLLFIFFFMFAFIMPSCSGGARMIFPLIGDAITKSGVASNIVSAYAAGAGLSCQLSPSNGSFIVQSNILGIPLKTAYKAAFPLTAVIAVVVAVMLFVGTYLPSIA